MSKEKGKTQNKKRKLTRQEKKQIDALIRQSKGDGKPHTAQDSIPFERMYKDGICRLANGRYSKCIHPVTFYSSPFFLDMSTQFISLG